MAENQKDNKNSKGMVVECCSENFDEIAECMVRKLSKQDVLLMFAYNGVGKTRLSRHFAHLDAEEEKHTLYYNAYTEDLFTWDNEGEEPMMVVNTGSDLVNGVFAEGAFSEGNVKKWLGRYCDCDFKFQYDDYGLLSGVSFYREGSEGAIKVSRGEERLFVWCFFLAIVEYVMEHRDGEYSWVKYVYVDDPISSLDDNNVIMLGCDLAELIRTELENGGGLKFVVTTHHGLFYNVMHNELSKLLFRTNFVQLEHNNRLYRKQKDRGCSLVLMSNRENNERKLLSYNSDTPFFYHIAVLEEVREAIVSGNVTYYHFNALRGVVEKVAQFLNLSDWKDILEGIGDKDEVNRLMRMINVHSHERHSLYELQLLPNELKEGMEKIYKHLVEKYGFVIPDNNQ